MVCHSIEFYEGESAFSSKKARGYMSELDPELLYKPLEDKKEENNIDNSSTNSLEKAQEYAKPVIAGSGGGISYSGVAISGLKEKGVA